MVHCVCTLLKLKMRNWLLISSVFMTNDSTFCNKCSESHNNYLEKDPTWVSLERDRDRGRSGWMYYTCLLVASSSARWPQHSCKWAEKRRRAAADQLPASPVSYKQNCLGCVCASSHAVGPGLWPGTLHCSKDFFCRHMRQSFWNLSCWNFSCTRSCKA